MSPFLMENSDEKERTYLFSFGQGLQMTMASVGNWLGGYLPTWIGQAQNVSATSSPPMAIQFHRRHRRGARHPAAGFPEVPNITAVNAPSSPFYICRQTTAPAHQTDPAHAADIHRRGVDHAVHERLLPRGA
jgi:hypothetical protein